MPTNHRQRGTCTYPDCPNPRKSLGWCHGHYSQQRLGRELAPLRRPNYGPHECTRHQPGTPSCYTRCGCRCKSCLGARQRERKQGEAGLRRRVPAAGTARRLQGLARAGWLDVEIAALLKVRPSHISVLRRSTTTVRQGTAARVREVTDILEARPAPQGVRPGMRRTFSANQGWQPLAAWDDIDNPDEQPHDDHGGRLDIAAEVGLLIDTDTPTSIATRLGYSGMDGLYAALRKAGRDDLKRRLVRQREAEGEAMRTIIGSPFRRAA